MRLLPTIGLMLLTLAAAGCAGTTAPAHDPHGAAFTASQAAPADQARVYILPTHSKGMFQDLQGRAELAIFPRYGDGGARLGSTDSATFLAFDIGPGSYDLMALGDDPLAKVTKPETFEAGKTYYLRPTFFRSAQEVSTGSSQSTKTGMGFDQIEPQAAIAEIRAMNMAMLAPEGAAFLARTRTAAAPAMAPVTPVSPSAAPPAVAAPAGARVEAPPAPQPAAAATAAPSPAPVPVPAAKAAAPEKAEDFAYIERKLKELKRLRQEGLITQPEYDDKRKAILNAY